MKKLALICLCGLVAASIMTGCGASQTEGKENLGTVELAEYKGVKVNVPAVMVTDAEVESKINQVLSQNPKIEEVDRPAAEGDIVNIDYVGKQDGVEFAGGTGEGQDLTLGSGKMIDGFEDGLIGTKKGDKKELNLTFPEDYSEKALAGQDVVFEVTVNAVKEKQSAVLDDAFVQSVSDFKTVDEYRASVKEDLLKQKQQSADLQIQQYVLKNVVENSKFKLNKNTLSRRYNDRIKQYEEQAKMYGTNLSGMARANGMDVPGLQEAVYASVKDDVKNQLVILKVAELEGITLEDADRQAFAEMNGQTLEAAVEYFGQETLDEMALNQKVMKFMADNAVNEAQLLRQRRQRPQKGLPPQRKQRQRKRLLPQRKPQLRQKPQLQRQLPHSKEGLPKEKGGLVHADFKGQDTQGRQDKSRKRSEGGQLLKPSDGHQAFWRDWERIQAQVRRCGGHQDSYH